MYKVSRSLSRRKVLILLTTTFFMGAYVVMMILSQVTILRSFPTKEKDDFGDDRKTGIEYTLPSLDEVMNSVVDPDLQRVLAAYKNQNEQIPNISPRKKVVLASTWRSGSTFLGEIISSYPGAFYHYEPLMLYGMKQFGYEDKDTQLSAFISSLLNCNYADKKDYLNFAYGNPEIYVRNTRLWHMCSSMPRFKCYVPENIGKLCSVFPLQVMKLVRARLKLVAPLLEDRSTKVIWLVRDPRGVMNSRLNSVDWCTSDVCKEPKYLCSDLMDDYTTFLRLKSKYPERIMILRYEDLAKDPYVKSESVLKFIGLTMHPNVNQYLNEHLNSDFEAPWSTIHNPQRQATKWMKNTPWNTIVFTQYYCRPVMKNLGYRPFNDKKELASGNAVQLLNIP